ncbi:lipase 1-like [Danaus plexippus]|uniref:lipase 1-like n=1 Tax=Danaus plexippus TaxID=13037 RepID=UPI002AB0E279|nr:lipase 1-like [Danaus plexippus]
MRSGLIIIITFMCCANCIACQKNLYLDKFFNYSYNSNLQFSDFATKYGHPATEYEVITEDGYILSLFRLPGDSRIPILLSHGIQGTGDGWILRGKESLSITLANKGYDVWIGNYRGNRYSRRHQYLNPDLDDSFWNFSFHELGYFDLPAFIDTVLNVTKATRLAAVGHSQGNTVFYVLGSTRPEYNSKVSIMIALAPICFLQNTKYPVSIAIQNAPLLNALANRIGLTEVLGDKTTLRRILFKICSLPVLGYAICAFGLYFPLFGYDPAELEPDFFKDIASYFPSGSSWKSVGHYLQVGYRKEFALYDYGSQINLKVYNNSAPPAYDLSRVTMPVALLAGRNDHLSTIEDIDILRKRLSNIVSYFVVPRLLLNHVDHVWGRHMYVYLYPELFKLLSQYR